MCHDIDVVASGTRKLLDVVVSGVCNVPRV
jgi:hypothetical protein